MSPQHTQPPPVPHATSTTDRARFPAPVVGFASDIAPAPADALRPETSAPWDGETVWWRPGASDVARVLGWRWFGVLGLLGFGLGLPVYVLGFGGHQSIQLAAGMWKFCILAVGGAVSIFAWGVKNVVKARKDAFCIHCGYSVEGLGERGQCPECGRGFTLAIISEFKKDPHFFAHRHKASQSLPKGSVFAAGTGPTPDDGTR